MTQEGAFGMGCFAFEWRTPGESREASDWVKDVERTLNALPNVSSIACNVPTGTLTYGDPKVDLSVAPLPHPHLEGASFQFDIQIPHRHQSLADKEPNVGEKFRVRIEYGHDGPAALVVPLNTLAPGTESKSVIVVREYLAKHLVDDEVKFSTMDPSPFQADFTMTRSPEALEHPIKHVVTPLPGIGRIDFTYDPFFFDKYTDAFLNVWTDLMREMSLYYSLARAVNFRMRQAADIERMTKELIALHTKTGFNARLRRLFRSGSHARDLSLAVMNAEFVAASDKERAEEAVRTAYQGEVGYLRNYTMPLTDTRVSPFVTNGKNVVQQLESGRSKEVEVVLLAGSTVTGALAGAVVSAILNG